MATLHIEKTEPLTIKELAWELGVSDHYVFQMHAMGFPMVRRIFPESQVPMLTATVADAREWIEAHQFRFIHGRPVLTEGQLRFGFGLQPESWTGFLEGDTKQTVLHEL